MKPGQTDSIVLALNYDHFFSCSQNSIITILYTKCKSKYIWVVETRLSKPIHLPGKVNKGQGSEKNVHIIGTDLWLKQIVWLLSSALHTLDKRTTEQTHSRVAEGGGKPATHFPSYFVTTCFLVSGTDSSFSLSDFRDHTPKPSLTLNFLYFWL